MFHVADGIEVFVTLGAVMLQSYMRERSQVGSAIDDVLDLLENIEHSLYLHTC